MILKKSMTHAGVLISLIILVILLLVSWDKCFVLPIQKWFSSEPSTTVSSTVPVVEGFDADADNEAARGIDSREIKVELMPTSQKVAVTFPAFKPVNKSAYDSTYAVKSYLLVLAKYDKDLNKIGTLDVKMSEEAGGRTLKEDLVSYTEKYGGSLTSTRKTALQNIANDSTAQTVLKTFLGSSSTNPQLSDLNNQPTQEVGMFFELLGLVYKHSTKTLRTIYEELAVIYPKLPAINISQTPTGDANYDYLSVSSVSNKEAAADFKKALANFAGLKGPLNLDPAYTKPVDVVLPNDSIISELRAFMEEQIRLVESDVVAATGNICDSATNMCKYTFNQILPSDAQGNIYYYKLGVGVIHVNKSTGEDKISKIKPYTFGTGGKLQYFRVDTTLADQEKLLRRLEELERASAQKALQQPLSEIGGTTNAQNGSAQMDAYLNMLKPYMGNYPDEYLMSSAQNRELTLDKYIGESLAMGQININADLSNL